MKQERPYFKTVISKKAEASIRQGHPWVYDTEILEMPEMENGSLTDLLGTKGNYLGTGMVSFHSKIRVRLLSRNANDRFDRAFWERRVRYAWEYRKTVMGPDLECCRVIFGEADHFPGLTVDRFGDVLVTQTLSYGMERLKPVLFPVLLEVLGKDVPIRGIYERNDIALREREGLTQSKGWFAPPEDKTTRVWIRENGIRYCVDFENGQKTGFFLDQKYNRLAVQRLCPEKKVLDCFTHTGSFALNAGIAGASSVLAVDASETAITQARENARLNDLSGRVSFICADVFDLLPKLEKAEQRFDVVILDPPAFTKSRSSVKNAVKGYREINLRGLKLVKDGGYLATCSCSHFMDPELFAKTIREAAAGAHRRLRQVEYRTQAADHPILWAADESYYLKFYIFQVCVEK